MSTNVYVSSVDYFNVPAWQPTTAYSLGQYVRQTFGKDGVYPAWSAFGNGGSDVVTANFGATAFTMAVPAGFSAYDATATWDPAHAGAGFTLSNGNLTASRASASAWQSVRATISHNDGKRYFEIHVDTLSSNSNSDQILGLADRVAPMTNFTGSTPDSLGYQGNGSGQQIPGWQSVPSMQGATLCLAVDLDAGLVWARASTSTNWNNSATADPATGVGGYPFILGPGYGNERIFKVTTAGNSGASEPSWNKGNNATTGDGSVTWTQVGGQESEQLPGNWRAPLASISNATGQVTAGFNVRVYVASDHVEAPNASVGINAGNCDFIVSVNRLGATLPPTQADYQRGAKVKSLGNQTLTIAGGVYLGIDFTCGLGTNQAPTLTTGNGTGGQTYLDDCSLTLGATGASVISLAGNQSFPGHSRWNNTPVNFNAAGQSISLNAAADFEWYNTSAAVGGSVIPTALFTFPGANQARKAQMHGLDLSALSTNLFTGGPSLAAEMWDCKLHPSVNVPANTDGGDALTGFRMVNCDDGTNARNYRYLENKLSCTVRSAINCVRVSGASDGVQAFSHRHTMKGGGTFIQHFVGSWMSRRLNTVGAPVTLSLELVSFLNPSLLDTDVWMEVEVLDNAGAPLASLKSTRGPIIGVGSAPPTSSAIWTAPARQNSFSYVAYDIISVASNPGRVFINTFTGAAVVTGSSEPAGFATAVDGDTVGDGFVTWRCGRRHKFQVTFTPQIKGIVRARICSKAPTLTNQPQEFYVDPKLVIT